MSAILAVCGTAFCAMVSDGRMVEEPITDGKIKVLTDALPKVRKLNRNVLVGFAAEDSMHCGAMDPDFIKWSQCSEAKCFPIECSRLYAAWPKAS